MDQAALDLVMINVQALKSLKFDRDELDKEIKKLEDEIKGVMEETGTYEFSGEDWRVTWNMVSSNNFSQSLFKQDHPKLFEKYKELRESRRFILT